MAGPITWPVYDVTHGSTADLGPCVVVSTTYADGLSFDQRCISPAKARGLAMQLLDAAEKCQIIERVPARP